MKLVLMKMKTVNSLKGKILEIFLVSQFYHTIQVFQKNGIHLNHDLLNNQDDF